MAKKRRLQNGDILKFDPPGLQTPETVKPLDDYIHLEDALFPPPESPRKKRTKPIKRLVGLAATLTILSGGIKAYEKNQETRVSEATDKARITWLAETSRPKDPFATLSQETAINPFQNRNLAEETAVSNHIHQIFQDIGSARGISAQELNLCTAAFKNFTTSLDGVCFARQVPESSYTNFLDMALSIPKTDLTYLANDEIEKMLFCPEILGAKRILCKNPTNTEDFAQRSFECGFCYRLHREMINPLKNHEKNTPYIYWDKRGNPTISVGVNLSIYPFLLKYIRFKNSTELQKILYPDNPELRSKKPYIILTHDNLRTLTKYVIKNNKMGDASLFNDSFTLDTYSRADSRLAYQYFQVILASSIRTAARDMGIDRTERGFELLFGTPKNPIQIEAPEVATDIVYRGGSLEKSTEFRKAYCDRNWQKVREECVPDSFKKANFWFRFRAERFRWRQFQISKLINKDQNWFKRNPWIFSLLALPALFTQRKRISQLLKHTGRKQV